MKFYLSLIFCFAIILNYGQNDSITAKEVRIFNSNYKEFEVVGSVVYSVTKNNNLVVFDLLSNKIINTRSNVVSITKSRNNEIFYITTENKVISDKKTEIISNFVSNPYKLLLDKTNSPIIISDKGLIYKGKLYEPKNIEYNYRFYGIKSIKDKTRVFENPDLVYLDKKERLWLTYDRGEFGEDVLFFDLNKKVFFEEGYLMIDADYQYNDEKRYLGKLIKTFPDKIKVTEKDTLYKFPYQMPIRHPIRGIVEKEGKFFISQSLLHFVVTSNFSILYDFDSDEFYKSEEIECQLLECDEFSYFGANEFLGPISLNKFNNSIYYYSHKGFFKIIESENIFQKEFIFRPWILWSATNRNNIGYDINITKFEFIAENELVFLTTNNGIGYFNGKEVVYFK